jgi:hypothetical protein
MRLSNGYRTYEHAAQKARDPKWDNRMLPLSPTFQRDRRAAARHGTCALPRDLRHRPVTRMRKGAKACVNAAWRRTTTGTNHISAYGVWRDNVRRAALRINRTGETRWHRLPAVARAVHFLAKGSST